MGIKSGYGDLNPVLTSSNEPVIDSEETFFDIVKRTARVVHTPDPRTGVMELRGVVYRRNADIEYASQVPQNCWLSDHGGGKLESPLQSYKIKIPELHCMLPPPKKYLAAEIEDVEHAKIERLQTFIAASSDVEAATEGQVVRVSYGNIKTQSDPVYLGPVFSKFLGPDEAAEANGADYPFNKDKKLNAPPPPAANGGGGGT
jgi:hypothetical protein